jgi:flavin reductase (DIM6/NTAB) family NADH-FMN oxidoreductase RutF
MEPILYVSLKSTHYSTAGVKQSGFFSVNIPSVDMVQKTDYCGIVSGRETDKSMLFTSFYDECGKAPMIRDCPLNFLCKVIRSIPISGFDMFLGEIVAAYGSDSCMTDRKPDPLKIQPMMMMGTGYYELGRFVGSVYKEGAKFNSSTDK